tara:strand:- start:3338 stop:3727 length:390 start_codon:yes stop_codon:yes gene_type:complete
MASKITTAWYIDKLGKMGFVEKGTNAVTRNGYTTDWTSISSVKPVRLYAVSRDVDLSINNLTGTWSQIPIQFHEAIVYKVISMGYKDPRNMELENAQYFDMEYQKGVKEGKKFSKSNYTDIGSISPQDF